MILFKSKILIGWKWWSSNTYNCEIQFHTLLDPSEAFWDRSPLFHPVLSAFHFLFTCYWSKSHKCDFPDESYHNNPFFLQVRDISPSTNDNKFYTFIIKPWNINQQQQKWIDECHLKYQISNLQAQIELNLGLYTYVCLNFQETNKTNGSRSQTLVYAIFLVCSKFY